LDDPTTGESNRQRRSLRDKAILLKVDHADNHRPSRIEGHVFKAPSPVKLANRLGRRAEAAA
jgi:hypothetical protein